MIKRYKHKGLRELFETGKTRFIEKTFHARIVRKLDALNAAEAVEDINLPGFNFHALRGFKPKRYTIHVNGPWCITFTFDNGHADEVDFENYHQN